VKLVAVFFEDISEWRFKGLRPLQRLHEHILEQFGTGIEIAPELITPLSLNILPELRKPLRFSWKRCAGSHQYRLSN
jgi:hypothetical protein